MTWIQHDDNARGLYAGQEKHNSYEGIIHGGIISALLDECIGWALVEDSFDKLETNLSLSPKNSSWSLWDKLLRWALKRKRA